MDHLSHLVFLHSMGFTQKALSRIFEENEDYRAFYDGLDRKGLLKLGFKEEKAQVLLTEKEKLSTGKISGLLEKLEIRIVTVKDPLYPELLRETPVHPYFLYVRGALPAHSDLISVVGSRKSTPYSRTVLSDILPELIQNGYGIISGGAYGVDSLGHRLALENGGYTLAVFGTGIDRCYPKENKDLFLQILASGGALVSPFPLGMGPEPYNFPVRNEIVAGISRGTLVTEAAEKSGTLITAGLALDFGRDVFAVPGEINRSSSTGTNKLIRDGQAKLILGASDILSEYNEVLVVIGGDKAENRGPVFEDALEQAIYDLLRETPLDAGTIAEKLATDITTVVCRLSILEVRGAVEIEMNGSYAAKR